VVEAAGHFRIYLGAAAGVGKAYAMLSEGHRRRDRGADVVIGFVDSHGRPLTENLVSGLEVVPRTVLDYRGCMLAEMDTAAVLRRRPKVAVVDERRTRTCRAPGPHEKRWQDVLDLLAAGIDVITATALGGTAGPLPVPGRWRRCALPGRRNSRPTTPL
jgi:two-component system, OmpR family, sensor histidine kinase KdpD